MVLTWFNVILFQFVGIEFGNEGLHKNYSLGKYLVFIHQIVFNDFQFTSISSAFFLLDATHAAELDMIVSPLFRKVRVDPEHDATSKSVTKLWGSFIRNG